MPWITLPHQLNNRKFTKAVVFVHGLNGSAASWKGGPNKFVDLLSRERPIYNHIALYVFQYDPKIFAPGPAWKLLARIPGCADFVQKATFKAAIRKIATELKATLLEMLPGYKTVVLVGHGMGGLVITRALVNMPEPPKIHYLDIDDPDDHVAYNKVSALLHDILYFADHESSHAENHPSAPDPN